MHSAVWDWERQRLQLNTIARSGPQELAAACPAACRLPPSRRPAGPPTTAKQGSGGWLRVARWSAALAASGRQAAPSRPDSKLGRPPHQRCHPGRCRTQPAPRHWGALSHAQQVPQVAELQLLGSAAGSCVLPGGPPALVVVLLRPPGRCWIGRRYLKLVTAPRLLAAKRQSWPAGRQAGSAGQVEHAEPHRASAAPAAQLLGVLPPDGRLARPPRKGAVRRSVPVVASRLARAQRGLCHRQHVGAAWAAFGERRAGMMPPVTPCSPTRPRPSVTPQNSRLPAPVQQDPTLQAPR